MPAIINHKICDQSPACGGISVCPRKAIKFNKKKKCIEINTKRCTSCGLCVSACPINAIGCGRTEEEMIVLRTAIEEDPRDPKDLFVDRFGADIISGDIVIKPAQVAEKTAEGRVLIEYLEPDSIKCLLKSIPVSEILHAANTQKYFRVMLEDINDIVAFRKAEYPYIMLYENGKELKTVSYKEDNKKEELFKELK